MDLVFGESECTIFNELTLEKTAGSPDEIAGTYSLIEIGEGALTIEAERTTAGFVFSFEAWEDEPPRTARKQEGNRFDLDDPHRERIILEFSRTTCIFTPQRGEPVTLEKES